MCRKEIIKSEKYYFAKPNKVTDSDTNNLRVLILLSKRIEGQEYLNGGKVSLHRLSDHYKARNVS